MNAYQITALIPLLIAVIPVFRIANSIEREKNYARVATWDADKISDLPAYAKLLCKGMRAFAVVMGVVCLLRLSGLIGSRIYLPLMLLLPPIPLFICLVIARRRYVKREA
jgi:hypothetical protein